MLSTLSGTLGIQSDVGVRRGPYAYSLEGSMHLCSGRQAGLNKGLAGSSTQCVPRECLKTHRVEGLKRAQRSEVAPGNTAHGTQQGGGACLRVWSLAPLIGSGAHQALSCGWMTVGERQHLSGAELCWVESVCTCQSTSWEPDGKFMPSKSIALHLEVNQPFQHGGQESGLESRTGWGGALNPSG